MSQTTFDLIEENKRTKNPTLDLGNCNLRSLPPEVLECSWLESLNLSGVWTSYKWSEDGMLKVEKTSANEGRTNRLSIIPNLGSLKRLRKLILNEALIKDLSFLEGLDALECLDISATDVLDISPLQTLKNLKCLILSDAYEFSDLGPLKSCVQLEALAADNTMVVDLSPLASCRYLKYLDLSGTFVHVLSPLSGLIDLRELLLASAAISDLSPISNLRELRNLSLSYTDVPTLEYLRSMVNLRKLDISNNKEINDLSPILQCRDLVSLNISSSGVYDLSRIDTFVNLKYLKAADISVNDLAPLCNCPKIESLDISSTKISDISFIRLLKQIKFLDISDTLITDLSPASHILIRQLSDTPPSLYNLKYRNCEMLTLPPIEVVGQGDKAVVKYFEAISRSGKKEGIEAKILLIGESRAGKTSLCIRLLEGLDAALPTESDRTLGLNVLIRKLPLKLSDGREIKVNIFDFGGQAFYKPLHHFFYSKRSLYLFVTKNGDDSNQYNYWFEAIKLFGGDSNVILLHNLFGETPCGFNPNSYKGHYSYEIQTNLLKCKNLEEIKSCLSQAVEEMPLIRNTYPSVWFEMQEFIEAERNNRETMALDDLLFKYGKSSVARMGMNDLVTCLEYLHDIGVCLYYKNIPDLEKTIILNHDWAIKAIYQVLSDEKVIKGKGEFTEDDLKRIWTLQSEPDPKTTLSHFHNHWPGLLELMKKFKLCYPAIPNSKTFIIPSLLGACEPQKLEDWNTISCDLFLRIEYNFMPSGLFPRFVADNYKKIENKYVWNNEVVFKWYNARALVTCEQSSFVFKMEGHTDECRWMFRILRDSLDELHKETPDLSPEIMIPCICNDCQSDDNENRCFYAYNELKLRQERRKFTIECRKSYKNVEVSDLLNYLEGKYQRPKLTLKQQPLKAFVSYSKEDVAYLNVLKDHLSGLVRDRYLDLWDDNMILPGEDRNQTIDNALQEAKIIFVLLSSNLMAADHVWEVLIPNAINRCKKNDAIVVPIKLSDCLWETSELYQFQVLPRQDGFITTVEKGQQDRLWAEVSREIQKLIVEFRKT